MWNRFNDHRHLNISYFAKQNGAKLTVILTERWMPALAPNRKRKQPPENRQFRLWTVPRKNNNKNNSFRVQGKLCSAFHGFFWLVEIHPTTCNEGMTPRTRKVLQDHHSVSIYNCLSRKHHHMHTQFFRGSTPWSVCQLPKASRKNPNSETAFRPKTWILFSHMEERCPKVRRWRGKKKSTKKKHFSWLHQQLQELLRQLFHQPLLWCCRQWPSLSLHWQWKRQWCRHWWRWMQPLCCSWWQWL